MPYLMFTDRDNCTPLDLAIIRRQRINVARLLKLVVAHKSSRIVFGDKVDKHITNMIELNVEINDYLSSNIHFL
jgi:hypothetical protein